ncbi:MAG TPA: VOC family protein, partial [Polyangiaceae bacterium]|jgi:lactoylglutathione lyase|nr:VOC family protein [Polyangiaceae bacterium]
LLLLWHERRTEPYRLGDGYSRLVLRVSDVEAATQVLSKRGVVVVKDVVDTGPLKYSMIADPDGYVVELLQLQR